MSDAEKIKRIKGKIIGVKRQCDDEVERLLREADRMKYKSKGLGSALLFIEQETKSE